MRILGLNSSPNGKKSQTRRLVQAVLSGAAEKGAQTEYVDLRKLKIEYCIGCRKCFATGKCGFEDDYAPLFEKMLAADGMVWGSPNYSFCVNAPMKALIDRMADVIHCQYFDGKYCAAVCTAGRDHAVDVHELKKHPLAQELLVEEHRRAKTNERPGDQGRLGARHIVAKGNHGASSPSCRAGA